MGWASPAAANPEVFTLVREIDRYGRGYFVKASPSTRFTQDESQLYHHYHTVAALPPTSQANSTLVYATLRVRADPNAEYRLNDRARTRLATEHCCLWLLPDKDFESSFMREPKDEQAKKWIVRRISDERVRRQRRQGQVTQMVWVESAPVELWNAFRMGSFSYPSLSFDPITIHNFNPMSFLAVLPNCRLPSSDVVTLPPKGLTMEEALQLAETFCVALACASRTEHNLEKCPSEVIRSMLHFFTVQVVHQCRGPNGDKMEKKWDASDESRVVHTYAYLHTMSLILDTFNSISRQEPSWFEVLAHHSNSSEATTGRMLEYRMLQDYCPVYLSPLAPPTVGAVIYQIVDEGIRNLQQNLSLEWVPASRRSTVHPVTAPAATAPVKERTTTGKQDKDKKNTNANAPTTAPSFCVPLVQSTSDKRPNLGRLLRDTPQGAAPKVKKGDKTLPVCLKAMIQSLGCKELNCPRYHFPKDCSGPPDQVDLSALIAYLKHEPIKALIKPTEKGSAVFGPL